MEDKGSAPVAATVEILKSFLGSDAAARTTAHSWLHLGDFKSVIVSLLETLKLPSHVVDSEIRGLAAVLIRSRINAGATVGAAPWEAGKTPPADPTLAEARESASKDAIDFVRLVVAPQLLQAFLEEPDISVKKRLAGGVAAVAEFAFQGCKWEGLWSLIGESFSQEAPLQLRQAVLLLLCRLTDSVKTLVHLENHASGFVDSIARVLAASIVSDEESQAMSSEVQGSGEYSLCKLCFQLVASASSGIRRYNFERQITRKAADRRAAGGLTPVSTSSLVVAAAAASAGATRPQFFVNLRNGLRTLAGVMVKVVRATCTRAAAEAERLATPSSGDAGGEMSMGSAAEMEGDENRAVLVTVPESASSSDWTGSVVRWDEWGGTSEACEALEQLLTIMTEIADGEPVFWSSGSVAEPLCDLLAQVALAIKMPSKVRSSSIRLLMVILRNALSLSWRRRVSSHEATLPATATEGRGVSPAKNASMTDDDCRQPPCNTMTTGAPDSAATSTKEREASVRLCELVCNFVKKLCETEKVFRLGVEDWAEQRREVGSGSILAAGENGDRCPPMMPFENCGSESDMLEVFLDSFGLLAARGSCQLLLESLSQLAWSLVRGATSTERTVGLCMMSQLLSLDSAVGVLKEAMAPQLLKYLLEKLPTVVVETGVSFPMDARCRWATYALIPDIYALCEEASRQAYASELLLFLVQSFVADPLYKNKAQILCVVRRLVTESDMPVDQLPHSTTKALLRNVILPSLQLKDAECEEKGLALATAVTSFAQASVEEFYPECLEASAKILHQVKSGMAGELAPSQRTYRLELCELAIELAVNAVSSLHADWSVKDLSRLCEVFFEVFEEIARTESGLNEDSACVLRCAAKFARHLGAAFSPWLNRYADALFSLVEAEWQHAKDNQVAVRSPAGGVGSFRDARTSPAATLSAEALSRIATGRLACEEQGGVATLRVKSPDDEADDDLVVMIRVSAISGLATALQSLGSVAAAVRELWIPHLEKTRGVILRELGSRYSYVRNAALEAATKVATALLPDMTIGGRISLQGIRASTADSLVGFTSELSCQGYQKLLKELACKIAQQVDPELPRQAASIVPSLETLLDAYHQSSLIASLCPDQENRAPSAFPGSEAASLLGLLFPVFGKLMKRIVLEDLSELKAEMDADALRKRGLWADAAKTNDGLAASKMGPDDQFLQHAPPSRSIAPFNDVVDGVSTRDMAVTGGGLLFHENSDYGGSSSGSNGSFWEGSSNGESGNGSESDSSAVICGCVMRCLGSLLRVFGDDCLPHFLQSLNTAYSGLLTIPSASIASRAAALCAFALVVDSCQPQTEAIGRIVSDVLPLALLYAHPNTPQPKLLQDMSPPPPPFGPSPDSLLLSGTPHDSLVTEDTMRVQAACYCVGVCAKKRPDIFAAYAKTALQTLFAVLMRPGSRQPQRRAASECAFGALLKVYTDPVLIEHLKCPEFVRNGGVGPSIKVGSAEIGALTADRFCDLLREWFPLTEDEDESRTVTDVIVDFVLRRPVPFLLDNAQVHATLRERWNELEARIMRKSLPLSPHMSLSLGSSSNASLDWGGGNAAPGACLSGRQVSSNGNSGVETEEWVNPLTILRGDFQRVSIYLNSRK